MTTAGGPSDNHRGEREHRPSHSHRGGRDTITYGGEAKTGTYRVFKLIIPPIRGIKQASHYKTWKASKTSKTKKASEARETRTSQVQQARLWGDNRWPRSAAFGHIS